MLSLTPRLVAHSLISAVKLNLTLSYTNRIPQDLPTIVVSNHRSFVDAPILNQALPF